MRDLSKDSDGSRNVHSPSWCVLTSPDMEESSRRYLAGRGPWPSGQWASHSLSSRQCCQLGRKLAPEGLDEVMGADSGD